MSVNGPMAKNLEDMIFYSKAVVDAQAWLMDPKVLPIPWRPVERKGKLRIAVLWNDGIVRPTPPVTRALNETIEKLKAAGHEIVGTWDPTLHRKGVELLVSSIFIPQMYFLYVLISINRRACS
jgi:amidase